MSFFEWSSFDESNEPYEDKSDKLGYESGSAGTFATGLDGLLRAVGLPLCVTFSGDDSCGDDSDSLVPQVNIHESVPGGY